MGLLPVGLISFDNADTNVDYTGWARWFSPRAKADTSTPKNQFLTTFNGINTDGTTAPTAITTATLNDVYYKPVEIPGDDKDGVFLLCLRGITAMLGYWIAPIWVRLYGGLMEQRRLGMGRLILELSWIVAGGMSCVMSQKNLPLISITAIAGVRFLVFRQYSEYGCSAEYAQRHAE